jgi:hypothetical protein
MKLFKTHCACHEFSDDSIDAYCILPKQDGSRCPMTRSGLFQTLESEIGKPGISHVYSLSGDEYRDICAQRKVYEDYCERLMKELGGVV